MGVCNKGLTIYSIGANLARKISWTLVIYLIINHNHTYLLTNYLIVRMLCELCTNVMRTLMYLPKDLWTFETIEVNFNFRMGHGTDTPNFGLSLEFRDGWHLLTI